MKYIRKPLIIVPTIIALMIIAVLTSFSKFENITIFPLILSICLMLISFIEALISKRWIKGFLYFIFYGFLFIVFIITVFVGYTMVPDEISGTDDFYNDKLNYHLELDRSMNLSTLCRQEKIFGIGPGGGDYNAACLFALDSKEYKTLMSKIQASNSFKKNNITKFDHTIDLNELECTNSLMFKKIGYQSVNNGDLYAEIVMTLDNKYCLFKLHYF